MSAGPTRSRFIAALLCRGATLVCCGVGLLTNAWGLPFLSVQANLLVFGYIAAALYWMVRRGTADAPAPMLRGIVTVAIIFVGLISPWVYGGGENPLPGLVAADPALALVNRSAFLIHWVVPALMLVDWIAFGPHRAVSWRRALWWVAFPLGYALVMIARSIAFPDVWARYPVDFLDPAVNGWGGVVLALLPLVALVFAVAALLWGVDRLVGRPGARRAGARRAGARRAESR
ncbi:Pr6Pr family membrane protein [Microbacterium hominis]|uniref:Pr6Pr family membrane protein n=1 Tax=Microbacterium hominis TaxID=162426 RepID=A0A7D4Q3F2_9MICO|nr:Pr6Pr family membrane protein [Microbacterium hominis]QKJ20952.1 Pr6Pr family membrane protein [Microbacterium hominis]